MEIHTRLFKCVCVFILNIQIYSAFRSGPPRFAETTENQGSGIISHTV